MKTPEPLNWKAEKSWNTSREITRAGWLQKKLQMFASKKTSVCFCSLQSFSADPKGKKGMTRSQWSANGEKTLLSVGSADFIRARTLYPIRNELVFEMRRWSVDHVSALLVSLWRMKSDKAMLYEIPLISSFWLFDLLEKHIHSDNIRQRKTIFDNLRKR